MDELEEAFETCQGNLGSLPARYKRWKGLSHYRTQWSFLESLQIRENVCEAHMGFDYLRSLDLWLNPGLTIKVSHNLLSVLAVAGIMEGVLFDLLLSQVNDSVIGEEMSRWEVSKVRNLLCKKKLLNGNWDKQLTHIFNFRNLIHLQKDRTVNMQDSTADNALFQLQLDDLDGQLGHFRTYIQTKYA